MLEDTIKNIIVALKRIHDPNLLPEKDGNELSIRGLIAAGNGRSIHTSREMERLINIVARELKRNDKILARTHTDREWHQMVRRAFGPALATIDLDGNLSRNANSICFAIREFLKSSNQSSGPCEHTFGCTLFSNFGIAPFDIGPVRFEPRSEWLTRKAKNGDISKITARRMAKKWTGTRLRKRKHSIEAMRESDILDAVGNSPYVCSVKTEDLAPEAGRLKAQTAARMAMATISLCWQEPSSALEGFKLLIDSGMRRQCLLFYIPGKITLAPRVLRGLPHGPNITAADWTAVVKQFRTTFDVAGDAISYFTSSAGVVARPKLMNTLSQALLWFHEGCREEVALMAVVKFSASLDALAVGRKAPGIRRLVTARLGIQERQAIRKDGPSMKAAINEIYSDGRSRTIHGTIEKLGYDWSSTRALSEQFARLCLISTLDWTAKNPALDDPLQLQR